ncbi:hypothetical protein NQT62_14705 [Limnobacter humi]|uniref:SpoVT-AbrB domain-containing protein n=1 Tax=Limnobacter humi TaxID=1778671 RepID=A0ABT1WJW7_9BURK|nr:hypothetical protein [Limnobacter humi]MCQ8897689.1 hypothetical protein [Limnobacter humi]
MHSEIKRWGNSAAIRLSSKLLAEARLDVSSPVNIEVLDGKIIIEPLMQVPRRRVHLPFTEADLLEGLNPESAHADLLAKPFGAELGADFGED